MSREPLRTRAPKHSVSAWYRRLAIALLLGVVAIPGARAYDIPVTEAVSYINPLDYVGIQRPAECTPPDSVNCANQVWQLYCASSFGADLPYQDGVADAQQQNPCFAINHQSDSVQYANYSPTEKVFKKASDDFIVSLKSPQTGRPTKHNGTANTWAGQEDEAHWEANQSGDRGLPFINPYVYQRNIGSTDDHTPMNTCENYVYRSFYDVERWIDSVNACRGDQRCVVQVSLSGMTATGPAAAPGIARRDMLDSDGHLISSRLDNLRDDTDPNYSVGRITQAEVDPFTADYSFSNVNEDNPMPKNAFYAQSENLMVDNLIDAFSPDQQVQLAALINELHRGSSLYTMSASAVGGKPYFDKNGDIQRGFYDEWDFHNYMQQRTANLTEGEGREYRRRNDAVLSAWDVLTDAMKCLNWLPGQCGHNIPNALGKTSPGDTQMWQGDPLASRLILGSIASQTFAVPPALADQVGFNRQLRDTGLTLTDLLTTTDQVSSVSLLSSSAHLPGLIAGVGPVQIKEHMGVHPGPGQAPGPGAPPGPPGPGPGRGHVRPPSENDVTGTAPAYDPNLSKSFFTLPGMIYRTWQVNPPRIVSIEGSPMLDCVVGRDRNVLKQDAQLHSEVIWQDVCNVTNLVLAEWARNQEGRSTCLDPASENCDWQPKDFVDRFVTKNISYAAPAKEVEYKYCKRWTGGGQLTNADTQHIGLDSADRSVLATLRQKLDQRERAFEKIMKRVPVQGLNDFGTTRHDDQTVGNDAFGGGYSYTLGWHLKNYAFAHDGTACRSGGNATAEFGAHAQLFSHDVNIIDAIATVTANDGDSGTATARSHLYVINYEIFDTKDIDGDKVPGSDDTIDLTTHIDQSASPPVKGQVSVPTAVDGGKPELFEVPFQVGWVTVTVSAGIAYDYGVRVKLSAQTPKKTDCNTTNPIYTATASFVPFADLGVWVDADVSLAGIVGVGVEVDLTLVGIQLPLSVSASLATRNHLLSLVFDASLDLVLTSLKGELDFYIELFWTHVASFKIISWDGYSQTIPIFRTPESVLPLVEVQKDTVFPPENEAASELN